MSGRGAGGKGLGVGIGGKGKGKSIKRRGPSGINLSNYGTPKRHRLVLRDNLKGITKPAIRRLARRGGVKRMSLTIYDGEDGSLLQRSVTTTWNFANQLAIKTEVRSVLKKFLTGVLKDSIAYTEHRRAKTVNAMDVVSGPDISQYQARAYFVRVRSVEISKRVEERQTLQSLREENAVDPINTREVIGGCSPWNIPFAFSEGSKSVQ
ncbi:hypothetical protein SpCBS45565_g03626 [Spizellomyces sp. 'palustris']|nr:hypothetical protein SpCBS45565_g03626 [Spizellomyces sp. 'palustris']